MVMAVTVVVMVAVAVEVAMTVVVVAVVMVVVTVMVVAGASRRAHLGLRRLSGGRFRRVRRGRGTEGGETRHRDETGGGQRR